MARAFYIASNADDREWAARAWDDMGGSEPSAERADLEVAMREALAALEPVRAAERQEARADALEDAARRVRAVKNMPPGYTVDPARLLDELAENCRDRADGVTGRSEA